MIRKAGAITDRATAAKASFGMPIKDPTLHNQLSASMTNVQQILEKINQGQGSVGKLINDESFLKNAKLSLQKLDKATEGLEDQGPLSVLGILVNNLF